jgi:hypothetical protein
MSKRCERCGSRAINPTAHGREPGIDTHLCDVCYWRNQAIDSLLANKQLQDVAREVLRYNGVHLERFDNALRKLDIIVQHQLLKEQRGE